MIEFRLVHCAIAAANLLFRLRVSALKVPREDIQPNWADASAGRQFIGGACKCAKEARNLMNDVSNDPALFYQRHVFCCVNEREEGHPRGCCKEKGAQGLRNYMKDRAKELGIKRLRINNAGCLDRCELGPTMVIYPEGVWYSCKTKQEIDEVLQVHLMDGGRVERLQVWPGKLERGKPEG